MNHQPIFKLKLHPLKTAQAIDFIASIWPGVTHYYVGKVLYFADKQHCLDWGRTITGDRYVAMPHGPVPSEVYDIMRASSLDRRDSVRALRARVELRNSDNKICTYSKGEQTFPALSESDRQALAEAVELCRGKGFRELANLSHEELAWAEAVERGQDSKAPEMDLTLWFDEEARGTAGVYLREHTRYGAI